MTRPCPQPLGHESPIKPSLLQDGQRPSALGRLGLERLEPLLLVIGQHLDAQDPDKDGGEDVVGRSDCGDAVGGRVGRGEGEEEVLREFGSGEEEVLDDGDEEEVHCAFERGQSEL